MGYRLRFDGVNDYCQFGSSMSINLGTSAYTLEAKLILNATPASLGGLLGRNGTSAGFFVTSALRLAMYSAGSMVYQTSANFFLVDGSVHTYRLEHDAGGAWRAYRDGSLFESGTFATGATAAPLIWIGQGNNAANTFCSMDLEYLEVTGTANAQKWDANLSGGTGTTLPTTSGTNQATLINFPTDNSQWIFFSSGSTITATVSATMPQMSVTTSGSVAAPQFNSAIALSMPQMTVAASSTIATPTLTASIAFSMPQMAASISADNIAPAVASVDFSMPQMTASGTAVVIPEQLTTVSFTMPQMSVSATATNPTPTWQGTVSVTMPQMTVAASAGVGAPGNAVSVSFSMPQMQASSAAQSTGPVYSASAAFTMPQMTVQVLTGGLVYYAGEGSHIEQVYQSRHIEQMAESRQIAYSNQNRHIEWRV